MKQMLTVAMCVLIGLLVGGGVVYLKLHRTAVPVAVVQPTPVPASPSGTTDGASVGSPFTLHPPVVSAPVTQTIPVPGATQPGQAAKPSAGQTITVSPKSDNSPIPGIHFTAAQQAKFDALSNDVRSRMAEIRADKKLSESQKQTQAQQVINDADTTLMNTILTPSQKRVFEKQQQQDAQERLRQQQLQRQQQQRVTSGESGMRLTPEQKAQLEAVHNNALKSALAVLEDSKYSKQDQEQILKDIYKREQDRVMAILSPEQPKASPPTVKLGPPAPALPMTPRVTPPVTPTPVTK